MKRHSKTARLKVRTGAIGVLALAATMGVGPAFAEPSSPIAGLVNQIATVDQNLADLADQVAAKQENVNKALVDFQNAVAAQQVAAAADTSARRSLTQADALVSKAQKEFDDFMRTVNRQGNSLGSMTEYVATDDPQQVLDRLSAVDHVTAQQRDTITRLKVVRNQQANKVAATSATRRQADIAAQGAAARRADAITAVDDARSAMSDQQNKRAGLVDQRTKLTKKLAALRKSETKASGTPNEIAQQADQLLRKIPTKPVAGDDMLAQAAEAAATLAVDAGQKILSELIGQQQIPHSELLDELGLGGGSLDGGSSGLISRIGNGSLGSLFGGGGTVRPGLRGPQAVELVVNRAKSQLGVPYAWGGGDANGPTLGIRDGGVADSHGDYNKVGFDCSGLMIYAFAGIGIDLPHYTGYQYTSGPQVPLANMQRGDMIFYGANASQHVAMYLGDGTMIEAPKSGDVVKISPVRTDGAMPNVVRLT